MTPVAQQALPYIVLALVATAVTSFLLTPLAIRYADRIGAIDQPNDDRRVHRQPIPRAGGLAVAASFVGVGTVLVAVSAALNLIPGLRSLPQPEVWVLLGGAAAG
ncbi:MAG TPA: hypothetical protein VK992_04350, partial [Candidatus Caenarcaniphilales bacterium]|nr:hypothetical protein [Candidatus Caenarcaniphilales bacterium]